MRYVALSNLLALTGLFLISACTIGKYECLAGSACSPAAKNQTLPPVLVSITVTPSIPVTVLGSSQRFTATGTYSDGSTRDITNLVTWSYANQTGQATIDSTGLADTTGGAPGNIQITASLNSLSGNSTLSVAASFAALTGAGEFWPTIGLGMAAAKGQLNGLNSVTADGAGNLFVADTLNHVIRRIDSGTGFITNVAGTGNQGYSGDGAAATLAELNGPLGVAVDGAGNLFIADSGNNVIRRVDHATHLISTYAGSGSSSYNADGVAATAAGMDPTAVAVDSSSNVYIADTSNCRIRKVDAVTGDISTVAGNGTFGFGGDTGAATAAQLAFPQGLFVDTSGNIFIADTNNERIREVVSASGEIDTVAGNGGIGAGGNGGPATAAQLAEPIGVTVDSSGNFYIADEFNNRIQFVNGTTGVISSFAGGAARGYFGDGGAATSAWLSYPVGVALDGNGNLFIADKSNNVVRVVDTMGNISTRVGHTPFGFGGDGASAPTGELYGPSAVRVDAHGNLFIADSNNNRIRRVDAATGNITTYAGNGTEGSTGDGAAATAAELYFPNDIAVDANGNLYIADTANNKIRKVDTTGIITTVVGTGGIGSAGDNGLATAAEIYFPRGIALDSTGNLFIADSDNNRVRRVDAVSGVITTVAGTGVNSYTGDGGLATAATLFNPSQVSFDPAGNLYILDTNNVRLRKVDAVTGIITTVAGNGLVGFSGDGGLATAAEFYTPFGMTIDLSGNIFISDISNVRVRMVNASTGVITTIVGNGSAGYKGDGGVSTAAELSAPMGMAVDALGNLFVADSNNNVIRKFSP